MNDIKYDFIAICKEDDVVDVALMYHSRGCILVGMNATEMSTGKPFDPDNRPDNAYVLFFVNPKV